MLGGYLMAVDNKKAALEAAMKNIKKKFGDGAVMRLGENSSLFLPVLSLLILLRESAAYQEVV